MASSARSLLKKRKQPSLSSSTTKNANPVTGTSTSGKAQKFIKLTQLYAVDNKDYDDDDDEIYHISIKDLRARRVFSKPPESNDVDKVMGDLAGKNENPRSECGLIDGKLNGSNCKGSDVEIETPILLEKCVDFKEGLKEENPNLVSISEMCDDSRVSCEEKEDLIGRNPKLGVSEMCDDSRVSCEEKDLNGGNPNLSISEMSDDSRVNCEEKGLIEGNPNLGVSEMIDDCRVNCEGKVLIKGGPNLVISEMSDDSRVNCEEKGLIGENPKLGFSEMSRVNCEEKGLIGGNPNLDISEMSDDSWVNCEEKGLIGENPNFCFSGMSDDSRVNCEEKGFGGNPNLVLSEMCDDSRVNSEEKGSSLGNHNLVISEMCDDSRANNSEEKGSIEGNPNLSVSDSKVNCKVEGLIGGNPNLSLCDSRVDCKGESLDGAKGQVSSDMIPNLSTKGLQCRSVEHSEANVQTTPPDAVDLVSRERFDQYVLQNKSAEFRSPPMQISPSKGGSSEGKKKISNPRRNMGLNPCSRLKLFKAPNSFSYRRMLPFLMDLTKDEPSAPKSNPVIKTETDIEANSQVSSSQESIFDNSRLDENPKESVACSPNTDTKEEEKLSLRPKTSDSSAEQATPCTPINCPLEKSLENPISDECHLGTPVTNDRKTGDSSADGIVSLDTAGKAEDIIRPINPKTSVELSVVDTTLITHLSPSAEGECRAAHLDCKPEESSVDVVHSSPKLKAIVSSGVTGFGLARGILKRNPRGCRGICHCLNCASCRLNAEKAFEFSRNQWLDAEELAMDLMKELSSLRSVLEKSANSANDNAIVSVDQVQEICNRASSAEDIARSRLSQMSEDLHVHCRIKPLQRPQLTFSSNVQEKIIGVGDLAR